MIVSQKSTLKCVLNNGELLNSESKLDAPSKVDDLLWNFGENSPGVINGFLYHFHGLAWSVDSRLHIIHDTSRHHRSTRRPD